jgi:hypothetical protein
MPEEMKKFLMAVPFFGFGNNASGCYVQRCKELQSAVPHIVICIAPSISKAQG